MKPRSSKTNRIHEMVKNLDYSMRVHQAKAVLVASDCRGEGKSTFINQCLPVLGSVYRKKILLFDTCDDSQAFGPLRGLGIEYVSQTGLTFLNAIPENEKIAVLTTYFNELSKNYDAIFINMKNAKRSEATALPVVPVDGAVIIRSAKSLKRKKPVTESIRDREIPILGMVLNEGLQ